MLKVFLSSYTKDSLVLLEHPMNRAFPTFFLVVACGMSLAASAQVAKRDWSFKPFSVTSAKLGKEMSNDQIEKTIMCKVTTSVLVESMELLQNYDLIGSTTSEDGTVTMTSFKGRQGGRSVPVVLATDNANHRLSWIIVNNQAALSCAY